jgi:hypothetical protein
MMNEKGTQYCLELRKTTTGLSQDKRSHDFNPEPPNMKQDCLSPDHNVRYNALSTASVTAYIIE